MFLHFGRGSSPWEGHTNSRTGCKEDINLQEASARTLVVLAVDG